jgi:hypothetical protein
LVEPWRTSPAAKTPGRLVSSKVGGRSSGHSTAVGRNIAAGKDESAIVEQDRSREPFGAWFGADEDEHRIRGQGLGRCVTVAAKSHRVEAADAGDRRDLRAQPDVDVGRGLDLPY